MSETGLNSTEILSHQVLTLYFPMNWTIITINNPTMICESNYYFIIIFIVL